MKALWLALAPLALPLSDQLSTTYEAGKTVRVTTTTSFSMEVVDFETLVDGEPVEGRGGGGGDRSSEETRTVEVVDKWLAVGDGRPTKVQRSFGTVSGEGVSRFGDNEADVERESPLAETVLMLEETENGLEIEATEGDVSDEALEGHRPELALEALMPEDDVALDASWDLDGDTIARVLGLDLEKIMFPEPEREPAAEGERGQGRRGRGQRGAGRSPFRPLHELDWTGKATLVSLEEDHEGQNCARISIEIEGAAELAQQERGGRGGRRGGRALELSTNVPIETQFEVELEGSLWFALDAHLPVELSLEGKVSSDQHTEFERGDMTRTMIMLQEGEFSHTVLVTVEGEAKAVEAGSSEEQSK